MNELNARISFLEDEIAKCKNLSSAASNLSAALGRIGDKFKQCGTSLSSGGFIIDGKGVDVYAFGGFELYITNNIKPIISSLSSLTSSIATSLIRYDNELTNCINERNRLKRLEATEIKPITPIKDLKKERMDNLRERRMYEQ